MEHSDNIVCGYTAIYTSCTSASAVGRRALLSDVWVMRDMGLHLSKYWNIYWRLFAPVSIGNIDSIFLSCLNVQSNNDTEYKLLG